MQKSPFTRRAFLGGMGRSDTEGMAETEEIVAFAEVDVERGSVTLEKHPDVPVYSDYRRLLDRLGDRIDAVVISTPDHSHAPIALMAIEMGKHVRIQKPLAVTVEECYAIADAARRKGVVACMGIQGHSNEGTRLLCEWIWQGAIGEVTEVHYWTNRPIWPQGDLSGTFETPKPPKHIHWSQWVGPSAYHPYTTAIHPFMWRGWWDYGTGALGDIGCHAFDAAYWALDIEGPTSARVVDMSPNTELWAPEWSIVEMEMARRGGRAPVKFLWHDGGKKPPRPEGLEDDRDLLGDIGGQLFIGTRGAIMADVYGMGGRLIPETAMQEWMRSGPQKTIPRSPGTYKEFIEACKGGPFPGADIEYSARLTEGCLVGCAAIRHGAPLEYDRFRRRFPNAPEADRFLSRQYNGGRTLQEALRREFV